MVFSTTSLVTGRLLGGSLLSTGAPLASSSLLTGRLLVTISGLLGSVDTFFVSRSLSPWVILGNLVCKLSAWISLLDDGFFAGFLFLYISLLTGVSASADRRFAGVSRLGGWLFTGFLCSVVGFSLNVLCQWAGFGQDFPCLHPSSLKKISVRT